MHRKSENGDPPSQAIECLHNIIQSYAESRSMAPALLFKSESYSYRELADLILRLAHALKIIGIAQQARVAVLLPNCPEAVVSAFATFEAGGIYVPVNPLLRPRQILHVLRDCGASVLVTTRYLFASLADRLYELEGFDAIIFANAPDIGKPVKAPCRIYEWSELSTHETEKTQESNRKRPGSDPAIIFYTSGSTGRAKGVLVSHQNLVDGARIVSGYLRNSSQDRILAALPLSFDYGFSQVTTTLYVGAEVVLTNYSLPQTLLTEIDQYSVTGLAGVPTMWAQIAGLRWTKDIAGNLRYITNSGGRLPRSVLKSLREQLPDTLVFLMYGLTEAFRSSYLDPALVDDYPDSIGKPIPGVTLHVVDSNGKPCKANEAGELVHSGALVTLGYWNNLESTAKRFRELPASISKDRTSGVAVWTGDSVRQDQDGFLFFVERADNMIKCSGYRISPMEIEEVVYESGLVEHVIAVGLPASYKGQRIGLAVVPKSTHEENDFAIRHICARELPPYMHPDEICILDSLPMTANGKPDRIAIAKLF